MGGCLCLLLLMMATSVLPGAVALAEVGKWFQMRAHWQIVAQKTNGIWSTELYEHWCRIFYLFNSGFCPLIIQDWSTNSFKTPWQRRGHSVLACRFACWISIQRGIIIGRNICHCINTIRYLNQFFLQLFPDNLHSFMQLLSTTKIFTVKMTFICCPIFDHKNGLINGPQMEVYFRRHIKLMIRTFVLSNILYRQKDIATHVVCFIIKFMLQ